ncbi:hypothetical protein MFLAVUS_009640 [Mucor flavus]|uniref:Uncharacterized protein n=1 Tax=Mucor flavus TaxID=439312 RepID=A0ABP9ZAJ7_9FUNG
MIRNSERNRIKQSENDEQRNVGLSNKGAKQFGLNKSVMGNELKVKANNKSDDLFTGNSQKKMVPLKRTESAVGLKHYSESKRQTIEKTFRRTEQESDWTPEGFDIDLSEFDSHSHVYDNKKEITEEELHIPQRAWITIENEDDTAVEYGPPKEIELPFEPESSCLVNVSDFTDYADESAYEIVRLLGKDLAEFSSLHDEDVLDALTIQLYQEDEFEFDSDLSELDTPYHTDIEVPFDNHLLDVEYFLQCN